MRKNNTQSIQAMTELSNEEKLPFDIEGRSRGDKPAEIFNPAYMISPVEAGAIEVDAVSGDLHFVPADDFVGIATLDITAENRKGEVVTGSLPLNIMQAPAVRIEIIPGTPVLK